MVFFIALICWVLDKNDASSLVILGYAPKTCKIDFSLFGLIKFWIALKLFGVPSWAQYHRF